MIKPPGSPDEPSLLEAADSTKARELLRRSDAFRKRQWVEITESMIVRPQQPETDEKDVVPSTTFH
jgi:hypothetical protein